MSADHQSNLSTLDNQGSAIAKRQEWMALLARADAAVLEEAWSGLDEKPGYTILRAPETGMTMVRARAGGEGRQFNFGEMTMTRCVVRSDDGLQGHAYIAGRDKRHAVLAAVFDAMLQDKSARNYVEKFVIEPVRAELNQKREAMSQKVAATKVDFFTMVRGED